MSTFNGSRFLGEQIDSILGQSYSDFRLMIRDDGSVDDTREIIGRYAKRDPRVVAITDDLGAMGAGRSFLRLVEIFEAQFFMLADQDDIWLPDKIKASHEAITEMLSTHGESVPLIAFTDLRVVDAELREIDPSMWHYQRLDPQIAADWRDLLAQNVVTGCTIIGNRAAANAAIPFALPEMMHDHWIAVNAAKYGTVAPIPKATVLYRQHGQNVAGGIRFGSKYAAAKTAGIWQRFDTYSRAARHFGGVSAASLMRRKLALNLRRLFS